MITNFLFKNPRGYLYLDLTGSDFHRHSPSIHQSSTHGIHRNIFIEEELSLIRKLELVRLFSDPPQFRYIHSPTIVFESYSLPLVAPSGRASFRSQEVAYFSSLKNRENWKLEAIETIRKAISKEI